MASDLFLFFMEYNTSLQGHLGAAFKASILVQILQLIHEKETPQLEDSELKRCSLLFGPLLSWWKVALPFCQGQ